MTYLLLIRHGENDYVGSHRLAGRTPGVHLNEKGWQQATALAERLQGQPIAAVYSSPLERCMETARPVADAFGLAVVPLPALVEADYGEWQGADLKALAKRPEWQLVQNYPSGFRFPGGETLREVQSRMIASLEWIRHQHPRQVVAVFGHSDVIKTALAHYLGAPLDLFQRIVIDTASVSVVAFVPGGLRIVRLNDTGPLPLIQIQPQEAEETASSVEPPPALEAGAEDGSTELEEAVSAG